MEIRPQPLQGPYLFGYRSRIYARAILGPPVLVDTPQKWKELRQEHRVPGVTHPYKKKTWALPITELKLYPRSHPYKHTRGAQGIVIYRGQP
jgi:hypothetical protein